jgi:ElaB/YqjD/DUF883 family membrane-anchored ribosome-binding protein
MDQKRSDQLQSEMNDTRIAISEKVAALEAQDSALSVNSAVKDTVEGVSTQMNQTVANVRNSVCEFSNSVKSMLNVAEHVRTNPWVSMLCSTASGFAIGYAMSGGSAGRGQSEALPRSRTNSAFESLASRPARSGFWDDILQMVQREARTFAETAIASLASTMKSQVQQQLIDRFSASSGTSERDEEFERARHEHNGAGVQS